MRKYEKKLVRSLSESKNHHDFLIGKLKSEWEQGQREVKREKLIKLVKSSAAVVGKTLLVLAAATGILTVAVIAPNLFAAFGKIANHRGFFEKKSFNRAKATLKARGYIKVQKSDNGEVKIFLTKKGSEKVLAESFENLKISRPEKWDNKWRIVIFDIPNRHKWAREGFREKLRSLGFYRLQESVFMYPYSCEEEVRFIASIFNISGYINFIVTDRIDHNQQLKSHFNLPTFE